MKSSKLKLASIILAVVLCLLVLSAPAGAVVQPNSDFYVLDNENVLSAETEKYIIDRNLNLVSNCKGAQVCVVVTDSTNGQDIEEYATELFNAWGIGSKTEDNGVLILFLTDDDNYWIMPGIGLERVLTERVLRQIIDDDCEPSFARKDYDSAAKATFIAINQVVCNYYNQDPNGSGDSDNFPNNNGNNYYPDDHPGYNSGSSCLSCGSCLALSCAACGSCGSCSGGSFMGIIIVIIIVFVFFKIIASIGRGGRRPPRPPRGGGFGGGFGGFGGSARQANPNAPRKGQDIRVRITLSFDEAVHGCKKNITITRQQECTGCHGSGCAAGTSPETCPDCGGRGFVIRQQRTPFGVMQTQQPCSRCGGKGKLVKNPCKVCHGSGKVATKKTLEVSIPMGIDDDQSFALRGMGDAGANGGPSGDVIVMVTVRPDPLFQRDGYDVWVTVPITYSQAVLGDNITVPSIDGKVEYTVPEGTQSGTTFRLRGKGIQYLNGRGRGDMYVKCEVEIPKKLNKVQRDALKKFEGTLKEENYEKRKGFFKRLKDMFA